MIGHQGAVGQRERVKMGVVRHWRVGYMWIGVMMGAWSWQRFMIRTRSRAVG